jgi:hypothetical protein
MDTMGMAEDDIGCKSNSLSARSEKPGPEGFSKNETGSPGYARKPYAPFIVNCGAQRSTADHYSLISR